MKGRKLTYKERMEKLTNDPIFRRKTFKDFLAHLERGFSADCFPDLSIVSIREFFQRYPDEFNAFDYDESCRKAKGLWESIGYKQSIGECFGNSRSWYYNMSNRYGWRDKIDAEVEHKGNLNVNIVNYGASKPSKHTSEGI